MPRQIENQLAELIKDDEKSVNLLLTMGRGGRIAAWYIRAYSEDMERFAGAKSILFSANLFHECRILVKVLGM